MTKASPEALAATIGWVGSHDRFVIGSHLDPDGDSLGSSLALALALDRLGKISAVVIAQDLPERFGWLPGADRVRTSATVPADARAAILVECSDFRRCGLEGIDEIESLNIDHHTHNAMFADLNWIDPRVAATGMMVRRLIAGLEVEITPQIATLLYVTVLTDTGSFRHSNTDAEALQFAADMVRAGADPEVISEQVYGNVAASRVRLLADALATLTFELDGQVAWMFLGRDDLDRRGTQDTEGMINQAQEIAGVAVSLLFKEVTAGVYRISMRSDGSLDVASLATRFGGGGHARASGCQLEGNLETVRRTMLGAVAAGLSDAEDLT